MGQNVHYTNHIYEYIRVNKLTLFNYHYDLRYCDDTISIKRQSYDFVKSNKTCDNFEKNEDIHSTKVITQHIEIVFLHLSELQLVMHYTII